MEFDSIQKHRLLEDIRNDYFKYNRAIAYEYITQGILTKEDLIDRHHLLTLSAYYHIKKYPNLIDEQTVLPLCPLNIEEQMISGDVDVLFWGVPGSGGKTSLLASLMTLIGKNNSFVYRHNSTDKNIYGHYLSNYLSDNRLPPATDQCYIQIVNTLHQSNGISSGVSFIEFAGEQVFALASNSIDDGLYGGSVTPDLIKILSNTNKKILFVCYDPTNLKDLQIGSCESFQHIFQSDLLSCVVSLMHRDSKFMKNVIAIHLIVTKSDVWFNHSLERSISSIVDEGGCGGLFLQIDKLAKDYGINKHLNYKVDPIPFSIGKFMMGDTYEFDNSDAKKILKIIEEDISAYNRGKSKLESLGLKLNKFFNS